VGLLSLIAIFIVGKYGIAILAAIAFRPWLFESVPVPPDDRIRRIYYDSGKWSFFLTCATILIVYFLFDYLPINSHHRGIVFLSTIPWFVTIHGLLAFIIAWPQREDLE
jgi:hypothetical protein